MWKINELKLFSLLSESSLESTNEEMQAAYERFKEQVKVISQSENDYIEIYRMLNDTRVELVFMESLNRYGQGEKCLEICLSPENTSTC